QVAVEQMAHAAAAAIQGSVGSAVDSLRTALGEIRATLGESPAPDVTVLKQLLGQVETAVGGGLETLDEALATGEEQSQERLTDLGARALQALAGVTAASDQGVAATSDGFRTSVGSLAADGAAGLAASGQAFVDRANAMAREGVTGFRATK